VQASTVVGRVGGLAVVLGIGLAANGGLGIASAAPDSPKPTEGADSSSLTRPQSASGQDLMNHRVPKARKSSGVSRTDTEVSGWAAKVPIRRVSAVPRIDIPAPTSERSIGVSRSESDRAVIPRAAEDLELPDTARAPLATPVAAEAIASEAIEPLALQPGPEPLGPIGSAASWTVLAATRREVGVPRLAATTADVRGSTAGLPRQTPALSPKDEIDLIVDGLNNFIGWIPVVGTIVNGAKFAIDVTSLFFSTIAFDVNQILTEIGNLAVDTIGLVPVVGAPLASLIYQTVLGGNIKLGRYVQASLQEYFDTDSTWSNSQFQFESVDVGVGVLGSYSGVARVSTPTQSSAADVLVDITNTGFEIGWSIPLEGRLALLGLSFQSGFPSALT